MTIMQSNTDKALTGLRSGDRTVAEVAKHAGITNADAQIALDRLVTNNRAVKSHFGGYLPYRPERGDTLHYDGKGRLVGVRAG